MSNEIQPASSPNGQGADKVPQGANNDSPAGSQPTGEDKKLVQIDEKELQQLRTKAGRFDKIDSKAARRANRTVNPPDVDPDNADPGLAARDEQIRKLTSENEQIRLQNSVRDVLAKDEYKDIPKMIKDNIARRPYGFVNETSRTLEDKVMDIEDALDDYLDEMAKNGSAAAKPNQNSQPKPDESKNIPPANGSGPSSPNSQPDADVKGKTGPARSMAILSNLFKNRK